MVDTVTLIVFAGLGGATPLERLVADAQRAATLDLIDLAQNEPLIGAIIVATDDLELRTVLDGSHIEVLPDPPNVVFHFGERLCAVIDRPDVRFPLYFSGASAPLLDASTLNDACVRLLRATSTVVANNLWSADFFGFVPKSAIHRISLPAAHDNAVPSLLVRQAGLTADVLPATLGTIFDLDTPADLTVLAMHGRCRPHARAFLHTVTLPTDRFAAVMPYLVTTRAQLALIGRVNTTIWGAPASDIPGSKRIFAEERGMVAFGRDLSGEARSLIGDHYQAVGPDRFFAHLSRLADVVLFDTRVLFAHLGLRPSAADRYASDLFLVDDIVDPEIRAFTRAARDADVPVIVGGHGVVAGSLWALTQEAWDRADDGRLPQPILRG